ncbi:MAG: IPT/TIG domain-containing protein [Verrucomicrobia bacterium]|nr:IPT/TIG domain-containing protein [Verrucomicrobiota bacterium]
MNLKTEIQSQPVGPLGRRLLGFYLYLVMLALILLIGAVWGGAVNTTVPDGVGMEEAGIARDLALIWAVVLLGALGGSLHALGSFTLFVGNRNLVRSWIWWYTARAPVGAALALVIYFSIRGGLMGTGADTSASLNPYGIGALAFMSGLFLEKATLKLKELFDAIFSVRDNRKDAIGDAGPEITQPAQPDRIAVNSADTTVTLTGEGFAPTDRVLLGGRELATTFVSPNEIKAVIPAAALKTPVTLKLCVKRTGPRGIASNEVEVVVA